MQESETKSVSSGETWKERASKSIWTFLTIAAAIVFYHLMQYLGTISAYIGTILRGISPVIWGLIFAYLLAPIACFYERNITELVERHQKAHNKKPTPKTPKRIRVGSSILTILTAVAFIALLLLLIIPAITDSISGIAKAMPSQIDSLSQKLQSKTFFDDNSTIGKYLNTTLLDALKNVEEWLVSDFSKQASKLMEYFYTGVKGVFNVIYNLVIGLILSLYVTIDREKLQNQIKKLTYTLLPTERALRVRIMFNRANSKLSTAVRGKIVDSMIIGMIHFVMLSFANLMPWFNYPYPVLLAVLVGVTNVVPFFGPIVGGFITGVLVLFENPSMCIPYIIMVVILQQFDSNFLDPHIVGGSIGLRPFWSISACLLGSAVLGVPGFILGPPIVSFIYELVSASCTQKLRAKNLDHIFNLPPEEEIEQDVSQPEIQPETKRLEKFVQLSAEKFSEMLNRMKKDK